MSTSYIYGHPCIQDERKVVHNLSTVSEPVREFPFTLYWFTQMRIRKSTTQIRRKCEILELQPELLRYSQCASIAALHRNRIRQR